MPPADPVYFGKFLLLERLGAGGMGEVFLANLQGLAGFEKLVVVKRLLERLASDERLINMFVHEAQLAAKLNHPNIAQVFEMGEVEGSYYLAMEYIQGQALSEVLNRVERNAEKVPLPLIVEVVAQLCDGLAHAHEARDLLGEPLNLIHRDLSPRNVVLAYAGAVKIIDFGIAKSTMAREKTQTGVVKGSVGYISPEQIRQLPVDHRSDIFALGVCMYEMCTLTNPFYEPSSAHDTLLKTCEATPAPLTSFDASLGPLDPIVQRALAKEPDDRYTSCRDLANDLRSLVRSSVLSTAQETIADFMKRLFSAEQEQDREVTRRAVLKLREFTNARAAPTPPGTHATEVVESTEVSSPTVRLTPSEGEYIPPATLTAPTGRERTVRVTGSFYGIEDEAELEAETEAEATTLLRPPAQISASSPGAQRRDAQRKGLGIWSVVMAFLLGAVCLAAFLLLQPLFEDGTSRTTTTTGTEIVPPPSDAPPTPPVTQAPAAPAKASPRTTGKAPHRPAKVERTPKPERPRPPGPKKGAAAAREPESFGRLLINTRPRVPVLLGAQRTLRSLELKPSGTFQIGRGTDRQTDPFAIEVRYEVSDGGVRYSLKSEPWAIVQNERSMVYGRTPVRVDAKGNLTIDLVNPKADRRLRVELRRQR